jgi:hypothetical protein
MSRVRRQTDEQVHERSGEKPDARSDELSDR